MLQDNEIAAELVAMMTEQKELMIRTRADVPGPVTAEVKREQREVFVRHADRLHELLENHGWPTAERVGPEAARGAWLIAQHADTQLDVQRLAVRLLREAVDRGVAQARELAFLEDRVAVNEGRYQVYGTQVADVVDGKPVLWPCVDPDQLNERRASVGIEPFEQNAARWA
ncbi:hypothetical protein LWF15_20165 [Kineosporia rhizophila]|uniref:DUF6624 domain-containing protein n=1 Tax=Kineosporia TaxID=49184 RepID=UPI000A46A0BD|nr:MULTISPECIES: DUF6624 domain-containing protein [Kineosporia]MCE0537812.1 hypothetical protein [Kineosporia rhizophila]GLY15802.1 hypothetical protein Kisp01_28170 [Kineosporia sp. NBRC 101677]